MAELPGTPWERREVEPAGEIAPDATCPRCAREVEVCFDVRLVPPAAEQAEWWWDDEADTRVSQYRCAPCGVKFYLAPAPPSLPRPLSKEDADG